MTALATAKHRKQYQTSCIQRGRNIIVDLHAFSLTVRLKGKRFYVTVPYDSIYEFGMKIEARSKLAEKEKGMSQHLRQPQEIVRANPVQSLALITVPAQGLEIFWESRLYDRSVEVNGSQLFPVLLPIVVNMIDGQEPVIVNSTTGTRMTVMIIDHLSHFCGSCPVLPSQEIFSACVPRELMSPTLRAELYSLFRRTSTTRGTDPPLDIFTFSEAIPFSTVIAGSKSWSYFSYVTVMTISFSTPLNTPLFHVEFLKMDSFWKEIP